MEAFHLVSFDEDTRREQHSHLKLLGWLQQVALLWTYAWRHRRPGAKTISIRGKMNKWIFLAAALLCASGHAQVVKCKDAKGKVIYSDVACPTSFSGSSVNLSGANITADQARAAQQRSANSGNGGGESCDRWKTLAQQTFESFVYSPNANRWDTSFQALQNYAKLCASPDACGIIKARIDHAQGRFNEDTKAVRGAQLNSVMALYANTCNINGTAKQTASAQGPIAEAQVPATGAKSGSTTYTKDEFGNLVRSDRCFRAPDAFGVLRRSPGCSK
jgi:hypothetical protein